MSIKPGSSVTAIKVDTIDEITAGNGVVVSSAQVKNGAIQYGGGGGGSYTTQVITFSPAATSYQTGEIIFFIPGNSNLSGPCTLNKNGLGAKSILRTDGTALYPFDITSGSPLLVQYNGTNYRILNLRDSGVLNRVVASVNVNTTTATTNLFDYTIPGSLLSLSRSVRLTMIGTFLNNTGGNAGTTWTGTYGGTTIFNEAPSFTTSASAYAVKIEVILSGRGISSAQVASCRVTVASGSSSVVAFDNMFTTPVAENADSALNLTITTTHSSNSAQLQDSWSSMFLEVI